MYFTMKAVGIICSISLSNGLDVSNETHIFNEIVSDFYDLTIYEWHGEHQELFASVSMTAARRFNADEQDIDRTNEVGVLLEKYLLRAFHDAGINVNVPKTRTGITRSTGYSDLKIKIEESVYYVEVKVFSSHTISSKQRTFYFTESKDPKITENAYHLLIGFEIQKTGDQDYEIVRIHCRDLRNLPCKVKTEYNSSNSQLYGENEIGYRLSISVKTQ